MQPTVALLSVVPLSHFLLAKYSLIDVKMLSCLPNKKKLQFMKIQDSRYCSLNEITEFCDLASQFDCRMETQASRGNCRCRGECTVRWGSHIVLHDKTKHIFTLICLYSPNTNLTEISIILYNFLLLIYFPCVGTSIIIN